MSIPTTSPESPTLRWRLLTAELDVRRRWSELCTEAHRQTDRPAATPPHPTPRPVPVSRERP